MNANDSQQQIDGLVKELNADEKDLLNKFFKAVEELKDAKIIRSDKYLGDIGEFLACKFFELTPMKSGRHPDYDAETKDGKLVQIKYHDSPKRTNIYVGNPEKYDKLVIVLGPRSFFRKHEDKNPTSTEKQFIAYVVDCQVILSKWKTESGKFSTGARRLKDFAEKTEVITY